MLCYLYELLDYVILIKPFLVSYPFLSLKDKGGKKRRKKKGSETDFEI